jgi:MFS transporter, UMF1 family
VIARSLAKVGLVTPEQRAWASYDVANSAYFTTIVTAVFPAFYATYAAEGLEPAQATARFGAITTVSVAFIAFASPILGAIADFTGLKKKLLAVFMMIGVTSAAAMVFIQRGDWMLASILFFVGNIGVSGTRSSTTRCCPRWPSPRRPIGCQRPATPWAISAAARSCC